MAITRWPMPPPRSNAWCAAAAMSKAVEHMAQSDISSFNFTTRSWCSGSLWLMSWPPIIRWAGNGWKFSVRLATIVICSRSAGSDRYRSSVIVRIAAQNRHGEASQLLNLGALRRRLGERERAADGLRQGERSCVLDDASSRRGDVTRLQIHGMCFTAPCPSASKS
nr:hypothetical protein [Actinocrinis puniceicyclus]